MSVTELHDFVVIFDCFIAIVVDFYYYHRLVVIFIRTEECNKIIKIEDEIRLPAINSNLVEVNNNL